MTPEPAKTAAQIATELAAPFPVEAVKYRAGAVNREKNRALALAYIDARDVQDRLDAVLGIDGWQTDFATLPDG